MPPVEISANQAGQQAIDKVRKITGYAGNITCRVKKVWWDKLGR
jgi:hypothetical protein